MTTPVQQPKPAGVQVGTGARFKAKIVEIFDDYLEVNRWQNGARGTEVILVARPEGMRGSTFLADYPNLTTMTKVDTQTIDASDGTDTERWRVTQLYYADQVVTVDVTPDSGVTVDDNELHYEDANKTGRHWAVV